MGKGGGGGGGGGREIEQDGLKFVVDVFLPVSPPLVVLPASSCPCRLHSCQYYFQTKKIHGICLYINLVNLHVTLNTGAEVFIALTLELAECVAVRSLTGSLTT